MSSDLPTEQELQFYYHGFYAVLRRYRSMTLIGWLVVAIGFVSFLLGWNASMEHGIIDVLLSCSCVLCGLALVQQSIASLSSYLKVPFPKAAIDTEESVPHEVVTVLEELMKEIDEGGWQEAYAAIGKLRQMETTRGLPPLSR